MEYVSPEGLRIDGRRPKELRRLNAELGVLGAADGSAVFEMGNTKVLAAVYGPKEVELRSQVDTSVSIIKCEYAMSAFSTGERKRKVKSDRRTTEISAVLRNALEQTIMVDLMPRSQVDIFIQVIQADGGTRTAALNAAFLALCDAGVPMKDVLAGCAGGYLHGQALLDLNYAEDSGGGPDVVVGLHPTLDKIVLLQSDSKISIEVFEELLQLTSAGCRAVADFMRQTLLEHSKVVGLAKNAK